MRKVGECSLDYVRNHRGLTFVKKGMVVESTHYNKKGVIVKGNSSGNLDIRFAGEKRTQNYHPKWKIKYFDTKGNVIAEYGD